MIVRSILLFALVLQRDFTAASVRASRDAWRETGPLDSWPLASTSAPPIPSTYPSSPAAARVQPGTAPGARSSTERFFKAAREPHQEGQRQENQGHMMMPTAPGAHFIVAHTQFLLAHQETALYRPAHTAGANEPCRRNVGRRVGEIGLQFAIAQATPQNEPDFRPRQAVTHGKHASEGKLRPLRPLRPSWMM